MIAVLLTIHTILVLGLVIVVLLQRSEGGGALGMGGGGGGLMSGRGAANVLTRSTTVLGALFFTTSMLLAITADRGITEEEILRRTLGDDAVTQPDGTLAPASDEILDIFGDETDTTGSAVDLPAATADEPVEVPAPTDDVVTEPVEESQEGN
ncbi:preprotein translocase subunit SecG [Parvularcula sp. LCG005]|uniref:preprotein translocase subunit SecG n=1 Tax=Parvularcula sp. LCG005 TaxID=3078805 RepID=UPI002942279B|nr:preprotein translocase subunit SecG [Parvularcula sp. LCG005]WOI52075.1 preprotein translocase subunit SecG [Parvularcula sp. LCG005]